MKAARGAADSEDVTLRRWAWIPVLLWICALAGAAQWRPVGPWGGNARALTSDPHDAGHILLGAGAGSVYESRDGGASWHPLAHLGEGRELMVQALAFDATRPGTLYAAGWNLSGDGGGFYVSRDGGQHWTAATELGGHSVQAMAVPDAVPGMVLAGALDGVFRSLDWGASWTRISPEGHAGLKNIESLAVDAKDPRTIYAGTWHLPWKTLDGGAHWSPIHQGLIDDSDIFSLVLDHVRPETVWAAACSGIYKSENGGAQFHRIPGASGQALRTRALAQDSANADVMWAGTTAGLWKTTDGGRSFRLLTPPKTILNAILVDSRDPQRVLIATDRGGVRRATDGGDGFQASNQGFAQQAVSALVAGEDDEGLYAAVLNGREFGGVFRFREGAWRQLNAGIEDLDVFDLVLAEGGPLLAATNRGVFLLDRGRERWLPSRGAGVAAPPVSQGRGPGKPARTEKFTGRVHAVAVGTAWYAAGEDGVLRSNDRGRSWQRLLARGEDEFIAVAAAGPEAAAATPRALWRSRDGGLHWSGQTLPPGVTRIYQVALTGGGELCLATHQGLFVWREAARRWEQASAVPGSVYGVRAVEGRLLALPTVGGTAYESADGGLSWHPLADAGTGLSSAAVWRGRIYLGSRDHGVLEEVAGR